MILVQTYLVGAVIMILGPNFDQCIALPPSQTRPVIQNFQECSKFQYFSSFQNNCFKYYWIQMGTIGNPIESIASDSDQ